MLGQTEVPLETLLGPFALLVFLLVAVVWGGRKRWWLFGWQHDETVSSLRRELEKAEAQCAREREEGTEWKTLALTQAGITRTVVERTTELVQKVANGA